MPEATEVAERYGRCRHSGSGGTGPADAREETIELAPTGGYRSRPVIRGALRPLVRRHELAKVHQFRPDDLAHSVTAS